MRRAGGGGGSGGGSRGGGGGTVGLLRLAIQPVLQPTLQSRAGLGEDGADTLQRLESAHRGAAVRCREVSVVVVAVVIVICRTTTTTTVATSSTGAAAPVSAAVAVAECP